MYFDDYVPGTVSTLRTDVVSEASIIEFARRFDPQDFHVNAAAAARGPYAGVIASGWHTCALAGHAMVTGYLTPESSLPSPGADEVRFHAPVRAGATIAGYVEKSRARWTTFRDPEGNEFDVVAG